MFPVPVPKGKIPTLKNRTRPASCLVPLLHLLVQLSLRHPMVNLKAFPQHLFYSRHQTVTAFKMDQIPIFNHCNNCDTKTIDTISTILSYHKLLAFAFNHWLNINDWIYLGVQNIETMHSFSDTHRVNFSKKHHILCILRHQKTKRSTVSVYGTPRFFPY